MTRRKGILKILFVALAVLLLAVFFAGCGEYKPPENTGGNPPVTPGGDEPDPPDDPDGPGENDFTATLTHYDGSPFSSDDYPLITRLQAQWTEITDGRAEVYRAYFNEEGVANVGELDGDFNVTLVFTEEFSELYTYDPNPAREERRDELKATNRKKGVSIPLYRLNSLGEKGTIRLLGSNEVVDYYVLNQTGAYKYELKSRDDNQFFAYSPQESGEYSFMTLMDITADEVNPKIDMYAGHVGNFLNYVGEAEDIGGAAGNYTHNVWLKYQLPPESTGGGSCMAFNLYSESEKPDAYPLTICFLFELDGQYSSPVIESVPVPVTEDFTKTPDTPEGTFTFIGARDPVTNTVNRQHILDQRKVKYNDPANGGDGYYYYLNPANGDFFREEDGTVSAQYRVYAAITQSNPVHDMFTNGQLARGLYWVTDSESGTYKNYYDFIAGRNGYGSNCNEDGAYPVNRELKQFLQNYAVSQRLFNDGNGFAEYTNNGGPGYNSDEDSQWLYVCGVYIN